MSGISHPLDLPLRREQLAELLPSDVREDLAHLRGRQVF